MVYCETFGQNNTKEAKFCRYCGATIGRSKNVPNYPTPAPESIGFGNRSTGDHLVIRCSLCGKQDFARDSGRLDSKWGFTSFKVVM